MTSIPKGFFLLLVLVVMLLLGGCAAVSVQVPDEQRLLERARAYWAAREAGDAIAAYGYESASVTGEQSLQAYVRRQGLLVRKAEVVGANLGDDGRATVRVVVEYVIPVAGFGSQIQRAEFDDRWVVLDGRWFHEWRPPRLPGMAR